MAICYLMMTSQKFLAPRDKGRKIIYMILKLYDATVNVVYIPYGQKSPVSEFKHYLFTQRPTKNMMSDKASEELEKNGIDNILAIVPLSSEKITCGIDDNHILNLATKIESEDK